MLTDSGVKELNSIGLSAPPPPCPIRSIYELDQCISCLSYKLIGLSELDSLHANFQLICLILLNIIFMQMYFVRLGKWKGGEPPMDLPKDSLNCSIGGRNFKCSFSDPTHFTAALYK